MKKQPQVTLKDIAQRIGVSRVTVSKALRDHPDISEKTKETIKKMASEMGYSPNTLARSLSAKHSNIIGVVIPKISNYFYPKIIKSIYDATYSHNYEVLLTASYEDPQRERQHIESLMSMRVDGLLVSVTHQTRDTEIFEKVKRMGVPLVFFDRVMPGLGHSTVKADDHQAAYMAVEHAIKKGFTRIAHLACDSTIAIGRERLAGFKDVMKRYGLSVEKDWVIEGGFSKEFGYDGFMEMYRSGRIPEIIFTAGFSVALGVYTAATDVGIQIPDDLDLIFIGDGQVNPFASRSLAHVVLPVEEMGAKVVDVLIDEIAHSEKEKQHIVMDTYLETGSEEKS